MKTNTKIKKAISTLTLSVLTLGFFPLNINTTNASSNIVFPLKKVAKLECRFNEFDTLWSDCLEDLPILRTSDYQRYATENWGYNKFTRRYTVLWWASYKYWWDVWYGWHMWVDIATAKWTPVYSMADWEVIHVWTHSAEWNYVSIKHNINWKVVVSNYMHLDWFDISKWATVKAGDQIWRVWSTWNSTWNHLHFQIDTTTKFNPAYYERSTCPYSYYEITEKGVCFNELEKITVDPLLFLETNWWILNSITQTEKIAPNKNVTIQTPKTSNNSNNSNKQQNNTSIFDKNVFIWSSHGDIREVQSIYKALWFYDWEISGDYNDVLESVIKYQLEKNIISQRWDAWTWNFWPKTRAQTKKDFTAYIKWGWKMPTTLIEIQREKQKNEENIRDDFTVSDDNRVSIWSDSNTVASKTEKISREKLMTREELEAKEVKDFLDGYKIDLSFANTWSNITLWWTETLNLTITDSRWKYFKWNMPWAMTFVVDKNSLSVFPEKLYYFTDWKREIKLTWLKEWTTTLEVKVWNVVIKKFNIWIFNWKKTITPDNATIIGKTSYLWNTEQGLAVIKSWNTNLINVNYAWAYKLKAGEGNLVCLKSWNMSDLKKIYSSSCNDRDFKSEVDFTYKDTVWWIVLFDYKALNKEAKLEILTSSWQKLWERKVTVLNPKWVDKNYTYSEEVLNSIEKWIATTWFKRWYFMPDSAISQAEWITWIKNALKSIEAKSNNQTTEIAKRLSEIEKLERQASNTKMIERAEMLKLAYNYLVFDKSNDISITYKDLDETENKFANAIFNQKDTWKEATWNGYFKPKSLISRWETAFMIIKSLKNWNKNNITLK